jgi:alcohol dehydrogenase class IV
MLPHVLDHNMAGALELYADLGVMIEPSLAAQGRQGQARGLIEGLRQVIADCGLPDRLSAVGVEAQHLELLASEAMKQQRLLINNPVAINQADAYRLYEVAL